MPKHIDPSKPPPPYQRPRDMDTVNISGGFVGGVKGQPMIKCPQGKCPKGCDVPTNGYICDGKYIKKDGKCYKTCRFTCTDMDSCKYDSCCKSCGEKLVEVPCINKNYKEHTNKSALVDNNGIFLGNFQNSEDCLLACQNSNECNGITYYKHNPNSSPLRTIPSKSFLCS